MIGKIISHYRILEKLGEGGMGVVYKAEDTKLDRFVALKFLPHEISLSDDDKARFLQEAKAASAVSHANVCVIHDIAEAEGQQFIVMEYVDGKTLRQIVPIQKVQDALSYAIQIGEALEAAHSKGVVHRDIKAENIMVSTTSQVKVMDFGLAKLRGSLKLTKTSSTVGTLAYMAPEQIQGGEVDARSDIFSFGVVLYEMLTGHLPFAGEHEAAMMYSILNESPLPVQKFRPELSSEILHILNRALEKDPEDRYQTVRDMVIDLRRAKKETSRVARPGVAPSSPGIERPEAIEGEGARVGLQVPGEAWRSAAGTPGGTQTSFRKALLWVLPVCIVIALAVVAIFVIFPNRTPALNPSMSFRTIDVPVPELGYSCLSRDGRWFAFSGREAKKNWSVYFMNIAGGAPRRLINETIVASTYAEVSPDGSAILFDAVGSGGARGVYVVSSLGGTSRTLTELGTAARWRSDGQLIGYIRDGWRAPSQSGKREFWTMKPDGSENRLQFVDSLSRLKMSFCFDWSPDGNSIAWIRSYEGYCEIFIRNLKNGKERQLTSQKSLVDELSWALNGQIFFTSNRSGNSNIWMISAKGGEPIQVTKGTGGAVGVRVSADGKRLLYTEQRIIQHMWIADINGRNARQITFESQALFAACFSPDNKRVSFGVAQSDPMASGSQIFLADSDGTNRTQLTTRDANYGDAVWSPDGKYLAYSSYGINETGDSSRVYLVDVANPRTPRVVSRGEYVLWINADQLAVWAWWPKPHNTFYSVGKSEPLYVSPDSTCELPLRDGKHTLLIDLRKGRAGWWLLVTGAERDKSPRLLVAADSCNSAYPSISLRYLLVQQRNGEMCLISLPDGKRMQLPEIFSGLDPSALQVRLSYDDKQVVYMKNQPDARVVLIENLFR